MTVTHFKNFEILDPEAGEMRGGHELVVEGDSIKEVSAKPVKLAHVIHVPGHRPAEPIELPDH